MSSFAEAKVELRDVIVDHARRQRRLFYSEAAAAVTGIQLEPRSSNMSMLLRAILFEEHAETGLLLTAVVVRQEDGLPGGGFYQAARKLGYEGTENRYAFWDARRREVFDYFSVERSQQV